MKKLLSLKAGILVGCFLVLLIPGCLVDQFGPSEVRIFKYHARECLKALELFSTRLYKKNPKYEPDLVWRQKRIRQIYHDRANYEGTAKKNSHILLNEAFADDPVEKDRVYLIGLGLAKSIKEAYGLDENKILISGLQIPLERLQRLHLNISQVNWRLKTYKGKDGKLLFRTNEGGKDGYINMGYEVLMTEVLTMIKDDIYLRGGLPKKYLFNMSTMFVSLVI